MSYTTHSLSIIEFNPTGDWSEDYLCSDKFLSEFLNLLKNKNMDVSKIKSYGGTFLLHRYNTIDLLIELLINNTNYESASIDLYTKYNEDAISLISRLFVLNNDESGSHRLDQINFTTDFNLSINRNIIQDVSVEKVKEIKRIFNNQLIKYINNNLEVDYKLITNQLKSDSQKINGNTFKVEKDNLYYDIELDGKTDINPSYGQLQHVITVTKSEKKEIKSKLNQYIDKIKKIILK